MASNGTIQYHSSLLNDDMNFVRTTYDNLLSLKQTNGSVSFEPKNTTEKSCNYNGTYYLYYRQIITFYRENDFAHLCQLPCPGLSQGNRYVCPWVFRGLAQMFSANQEKKGLSVSSIRKSMVAFNFAINMQNQMIRACFPSLHGLKQDNVTKEDPIYGNARKRAKTNKKGVYNIAPMCGQSKKKSNQEDVQKGHVEDPMSDKVLKKINIYFLRLGSFPNDYTRAVLRMIFSWSFFALMRGDDLRDDLTTWASFGCFEANKKYGPTPATIFYIMKDWSKTLKGEPHLCAVIRHTNVLMCPVNAIAQLLITTIGRNGRRKGWFSNLLIPSYNWTKNGSWIIADNDGEVLNYSNKKKQVRKSRNRSDDSTFTHYEEFQNLHKFIFDLKLKVVPYLS